MAAIISRIYQDLRNWNNWSQEKYFVNGSTLAYTSFAMAGTAPAAPLFLGATFCFYRYFNFNHPANPRPNPNPWQRRAITWGVGLVGGMLLANTIGSWVASVKTSLLGPSHDPIYDAPRQQQIRRDAIGDSVADQFLSFCWALAAAGIDRLYDAPDPEAPDAPPAPEDDDVPDAAPLPEAAIEALLELDSDDELLPDAAD